MIPIGEQWDEIAALESGDLAVTSYAVVLSALARTGRSGVLQLEKKPVEKEIIVLSGRPVECRSNLAHETFGRFLLGAGQISETEHHAALSESLARGVPLGEILIEQRLLSPHDVYKSLQTNLARKLLDGFTWQRGRFEITAASPAADATVKVNALQLILTGVLKLTPQAEIDAALAAWRDEAIGLDPAPPREDAQIRLPGRAQRVARALEAGPASLAELAARADLPAGEVTRIVYALALAGRVLPASELAARPDDSLPEAAEPAATARPATAGERPTKVTPAPPDDQALLLRQATIVEAYLSFQRKDSFELLGLEEGATVAEIDAAYLEAAETYAPWALGSGGDFAEQGEILFLKAAQAYAELSNSESRGALIHRRKVLREQEAARRRPEFSIETDLLDSEEQFKKGLALAERGELGKALELLEFAADCDPQNAAYRAELAYRRDEFDSHRYRRQATADLREAVRIDPACGLAHYYLGLVLAAQGELPEATESLRRSIKLLAPDRRPIEALKELTAAKR